MNHEINNCAKNDGVGKALQNIPEEYFTRVHLKLFAVYN